jgi:hypothetical protein
MCLMLPFGVVCTVHLLLYRNRLSGVTCYRVPVEIYFVAVILLYTFVMKKPGVNGMTRTIYRTM